MTRLIADLLRTRARRRGAEPLITCYDLTDGSRTELSAVSFLNWVDKTSNLLVDDYLVAPGAVVDLALARTAPGHWVTFVLEVAAWQVGATVRTQRKPAACDLLVLGPDWEAQDRSRAGAVVACSLHPLGVGFPTTLPPDVADFSLEVRGQGDVYAPSPGSGLATAWLDDNRRLTQGDLLGVPTAKEPRRRLVTVTDPWSTVRNAVLVPLLSDGSAVVVTGTDPDKLTRIVETERVDLSASG